MHTHTRAGMAIAAIKEGLQSVSMSSTGFHNRISYHDYEGVSLYEDERTRLLNNLGENRAMILRNHGLLVVGRTVAETFIRLYRLERSCQIQLDASAAGTLNILPGQTATKSGIEMDQFLKRINLINKRKNLNWRVRCKKTLTMRKVIISLQFL